MKKYVRAVLDRSFLQPGFQLCDLVFVAYFSLMPILVTYIPRAGPLSNSFLVYAISCFFFSLQYEKRPIRFFTLIGVACFITDALAISIVELFHGYGFFFVAWHTVWIFQGAILGYLCAKVYSVGLRCLLAKQLTWIVSAVLFSAVVIILGGMSLQGLAEQDKILKEINERRSLAEEIARYHIRSGNTRITTQAVIDAGIVVAQADVLADRLVHGYGGDINVYTDSDGIWLEYDGVPRGEVCHNFSYINRPDDYGFKSIYVGEIVIESTHFEAPSIVKELSPCFVGETLKTVRFYALFKDLRS